MAKAHHSQDSIGMKGLGLQPGSGTISLYIKNGWRGRSLSGHCRYVSEDNFSGWIRGRFALPLSWLNFSATRYKTTTDSIANFIQKCSSTTYPLMKAEKLRFGRDGHRFYRITRSGEDTMSPSVSHRPAMVFSKPEGWLFTGWVCKDQAIKKGNFLRDETLIRFRGWVTAVVVREEVHRASHPPNTEVSCLGISFVNPDVWRQNTTSGPSSGCIFVIC